MRRLFADALADMYPGTEVAFHTPGSETGERANALLVPVATAHRAATLFRPRTR